VFAKADQPNEPAVDDRVLKLLSCGHEEMVSPALRAEHADQRNGPYSQGSVRRIVVDECFGDFATTEAASVPISRHLYRQLRFSRTTRDYFRVGDLYGQSDARFTSNPCSVNDLGARAQIGPYKSF
jgi:hypothetical protein